MMIPKEPIMDIYAHIAADHSRIAKLIDDLLSINVQAVRQGLFEQLKAELNLHIYAKEQIFYRTLLEAGQGPQLKTGIEHAVHAHDEIRELLKRLSAESFTSSSWMVMFGELKHAVEHHIDDEETVIFAQARQILHSQISYPMNR
jgi:iron-sulfur cluster repair protein YtfE (RIC family)